MIQIFQNAGVANPDCTNTGVVPPGLVAPGDAGVPAGLTSTYYKTSAPAARRMPRHRATPARPAFGAGWGLFYNPMEQLVPEQFSAEPPFGGSNIINAPQFNTPYLQQDGTQKPNPFNGILDPPPGNRSIGRSTVRILLFGQFQPHLRTQSSTQYNLNIQRELTKDLVLQVGYVGSQGHRLLATHDVNFGNAQTCIDLNNISNIYGDDDLTCGQFFADSAFIIPRCGGTPTIAPPADSTCPMARWLADHRGHALRGHRSLTNAFSLVGLRRYSSPNCDPLTGTGCPQDGTPVFSSIFAEDTIANSNYNSLQVSLEKRFSHGLQAQLAYTFSKSFDQASSFEGELNPLDPHATYSLSQFDARHRLVLSYVWQLPIPKYSGFAGKVLSDWDVSGIYTYQSGFPIRITSSADNELMYSAFFEYPGEPDQLAPFHKDDRKASGGSGSIPTALPKMPRMTSEPPCSEGAVFNCFDPSLFGRIGNAKRTICCGPPVNNVDFAVHKVLPVGRKQTVRVPGRVFQPLQPYAVQQSGREHNRRFGFWPHQTGQGTAPDSAGLEVLLLAGKQ